MKIWVGQAGIFVEWQGMTPSAVNSKKGEFKSWWSGGEAIRRQMVARGHGGIQEIKLNQKTNQ